SPVHGSSLTSRSSARFWHSISQGLAESGLRHLAGAAAPAGRREEDAALSLRHRKLPSLGNASATFGGYSRKPDNLKLPDSGKIGKQLGTVVPGVPKLPTGLGRGPIVANPSLRTPTLPNSVVNGGKHVLEQGASLSK